MKKKLFILFTLLISNQAGAGIYKFVDGNGGIHYTDEPRNRLNKRNELPCGVHVFTDYNGITQISGHSCAPKTTFARTRLTSGSFRPDSSYASANTNTGNRKTKFNDLIAQVASKHQVDEKLVHAVIQTESAYNAGAISSAGAVGLMQLMPGTARRYGVTDRHDPEQNVDGGTRYLKDLLEMFDSNLDLAVAAYNAGENAVIRHNNSIPPYPETQNYVRQVLARYNR
jgi:hypothetical protein